MRLEGEDAADGMDIDTEPGPSAVDKGKAAISNGTPKGYGIPWVRICGYLLVVSDLSTVVLQTAHYQPSVFRGYGMAKY